MKAIDTTVREHIVETACRLFYTQGYTLTGINQIIEEAGVAKASLYYHFPSKEDLCVEYLKRRWQVFWNGALVEWLEGVSDPRERILKVFDCRADYMTNTNYGGCACVRIISELPQRGDKISAQVKCQKDKQRMFFREEVSKLKGIDPSRVNKLADTIFLLYDGAISQSQLYQDLWPIDNARRVAEELITA